MGCGPAASWLRTRSWSSFEPTSSAMVSPPPTKTIGGIPRVLLLPSGSPPLMIAPMMGPANTTITQKIEIRP